MKTKLFYLIFIVTLLANQKAFCQIDSSMAKTIKNNIDSVSTKIKLLSTTIDTALYRDTAQGIINVFVYQKYLETQFTYLSYERGTLPTGNSASLDLLDNETQLKLSLAKKIGPNKPNNSLLIATAGVQAKLGDGVSQLFNGSSATSGTTLFGNFAFLPRNKPANGYHHFKMRTDIFKGGKLISSPLNELNLKIKNLKTKFNEKYIEDYAKKYYALLSSLEEIQVELNGKSKNPCCKNTYELLKERDDIIKQLDDAGLINKDPDDVVGAIKDEYNDDSYKLVTGKPQWEYFQLNWFNAGFTYTRNTYNTYDNSFTLNKRFGIKDFDTWGFKFTKNWFKERFVGDGSIRSWYASLSYEPTLTNSYADITANDMVKTIISRSIADTTIVTQTSKKAIDISGIPYTTAWQHNFSGAYTAMFGNNKNFGINLLVQSKFSKISEPIFNTKIGLLVRMLNNNFDPTDKDSKSKVNFEIFIQFPDMSDVDGTGKSVWQNRVIGISTNIPFGKIFFK